MGAQCSGFSTSEGGNLEVEPESDGNGVICVKWRATRCRFQKIMPGDVGIRNDSFTLLTAFACAEALYVDEEAITRARQSRELRWMPTQPQDQPLIWSSAQKELSDPPKRRFPSLVEAVEELWASSF